MKLKHFLPILFLLVLAFGGNALASDHALPKSLSVTAKVVSFVPVQVAKHPKRSIKAVAGSALFAAEEGVDVLHVVAHGASVATAGGDGKYFGPVHIFFDKADEYTGKADLGLEDAERYFFGESN